MGLALHFTSPSRRCDRLRRKRLALCGGALFAAAVLTPFASAEAQTYIWGGTGSTTTTADYNLGTNWSNSPTGAPPVGVGQGAVFDASGSASVNVTTGPITPSAFVFNTTSQSFTLSGSAINFSQAGPGGGVLDNATSGQTISIANNIGETLAGVEVRLLGGSTLILSGNNSYSGGTTVSSLGTLQAANSNAVGTGTVTLSDGEFQAGGSNLTFTNNFKINNTAGGSAIDANGQTVTIAGNISDGSGGAGKLTVLDSSFGAGIVVLTGNNTYSGGTTICNCGALQLGDATHTGSIVGAVTNEGLFGIANANTAGITSIVNDGGLMQVFGTNTFATPAITNKNFGETDFLIQSNAGNATIVNQTGGVTIFADSSSAMNANITNKASGGSTLFFASSSAGNAVITNNSSSGSVFPIGLGFFDASTAGNATIINNNGLIAFGIPGGVDSSTAGNATITNNSGGHLQFDAFTTAGNATITTNGGGAVKFFDNSTGGNAQFITDGTGYVDFSGSRGSNNDGVITAGSIAGSGFYYIGGGNTLVVGGNNLSTTVSGVIADISCGCGFHGSGHSPGGLEKIGTGTLTLSGTNTYTGTTTVNGGFLDVEGSIASSSLTTVNAGGALTGAGTVGSTTIASGGIFLPGNGAGTATTVAGNLAFQSGALYLVTLNSTSTSAHVTGTAILAGTVGAALTPGGMVMKQYTILTAAGGVSGSFAGVGLTGGSPSLTGALSYDSTHAFLNFALDFASIPGLNVNQRSVGTTLTNFFNANGGISTVFATLTPSGLAQASGELATGSQQATFDAMDLFMDMLTDPFVAGRNGGVSPDGTAQSYAEEDENSLAYAAQRNVARDAFAKIPRNDLLDNRWSVWGGAYGGGATIDGNAALGSNSATARAFGFVGGADYRISPTLLAGFALAGGGTNFSVTNFGTGRSDLFQAGAFVRKNFGAAYVSASAAYGWQDVTTDRIVTVAGFDQLHAEFKANAYSGRVESGYRFATPWMGITPYAAGQFTTFSLPAYAEQALAGSGTFALNYAAKDVTDPRTELGVRTDRSFAMTNGILTLRGRLAWAHDYDTDRNVSAVFQTLPGAAFVVSGAAQARDSALTTASAELKWLNHWSAAATFEGEFSGVSSFYAGKGVVSYTW
jgi:autotransporter-associated beta strand protein